MEKVKLPNEIDKAVLECKAADISDYGIVCLTMFKQDDKGFPPKVLKAIEVLRRWTFSDMEDEDIEWKISAHDGPSRAERLMIALVNGWEVELTPEGKVKELYNGAFKREFISMDSYHRGMIETLDALGYEIEGVNA